MSLSGGDDVQVKYGASIDGLLSGVSAATSAVQSSTLRMSESMGMLGTAIERVKVPFLALTTLLAGGALFKEVISSVEEMGLELDKLSQKTGVSVEQLSRLQNAAKLAEVSNEELNTGFRKLAASIQEAHAGSGKAADAFKLLGVNVNDAQGHTKAMDALLLEVAEKFAGFRDGANKSALAMDIFGRSGTALIPFLNKGREGIEELAKKSDELGATMGGKSVEAAKRYKDAMNELGLAATALKITLGDFLLPILTKFVKLVEDAGLGIAHMAENTHKLELSMAAAFGGAKGLSEAVEKLGLGRAPVTITASNKPDAPALPDQKKLEAQKKLKEALDEYVLKSEQKLNEELYKETEKLLEGNDKTFRKQVKKETDEKENAARESAQFEMGWRRIVWAAQQRIDEDLKKRREAYQRGWEETFAVISRTIAQSFQGVIQGTQSVQKAFQDLGRNILLSMVANVEKSLEVWLAAELTKRTFGAEGTKKSILSSAWEAAAATYASVAKIPYVGWLLAPGAAAGAAAAVLAFGANVSAAGGYDIPAGVNPVVQTHAEEMILPSDIARGMRKLVAGGAGAGGGTVIIQAMDAQSFREYAMSNRDHIFDAASAAARNGRKR